MDPQYVGQADFDPQIRIHIFTKEASSIILSEL